MDIWTPLLVLLGITEPVLNPVSTIETASVVQLVAQQAPLLATNQSIQSEPVLKPIVINIKYQPDQHCLIAPTTQMIQRNLTLPYDQQTLYGTAQCQSDD